MANKRLRKELLEGMNALRRVGVVSGATMREFEGELVEQPRRYKGKDIRALRNRAKVSQGVFAALLNISISTLQKWEQGQKAPSALARKLLQIVEERGIGVLVPPSGGSSRLP